MSALRTIILSLTAMSFAVVLSSCSTAQTQQTRISENKMQTKLKTGETGVYVLRADTAFYNTPNVSIDGKPIGGIKSSSYLYSRLQPGTHQLSIDQGYMDGAVHYQFQVKQGQATYLNMAWGKLQKSQQQTFSTDNVFVTDRGWIVAAMSEQRAAEELNGLRASN